MKIKWMLLIILVVWGILLFIPAHKINVNKDPGAMYVSVTCIEDARGVTHCRDTRTGRSWTISPSPVGTYITGS